jgi:hypothetical protein
MAGCNDVVPAGLVCMADWNSTAQTGGWGCILIALGTGQSMSDPFWRCRMGSCNMLQHACLRMLQQVALWSPWHTHTPLTYSPWCLSPWHPGH